MLVDRQIQAATLCQEVADECSDKRTYRRDDSHSKRGENSLLQWFPPRVVLRNSEARGPTVSANRTRQLNKLTEATARRRLAEEDDGGPVRGNREDEARGTARSAGHHRTYQRFDSKL